MEGYLRYLVDYNAWANREVLEFLVEHPEAARASAPGVFGTAEETMNHLLASEASYWNRLAGGPPFTEPPPRPVAELVAFAEEIAARGREVVAAMPPPDMVSQRTRGKVLAATVFGQLVTHGAEHRTQVCSIIGSLGLEAPDLASWRFGGFVG